MILFIILGILLGALTVIFALQNVVPVTVSFLNWHITGSLSVVIFVTLIAGVLVSLFVSIPEVIKNYMLFKELKKKNKVLEDEIVALKKKLEEKNTGVVIPTQPNAKI